MKILALDTSSDIASVSLWLDGAVTTCVLPSPPAHSSLLLPAIKRLVADKGLSFSTLDAIAFGSGPGSFTGVRLACSVAQGLALGADLAVIPVCSLLAMAEAASADKVYCAIDARMSEAYVAAYERGEHGWLERIAPCCVKPEEMPLPPEQGWSGVGTAFRAYPVIAGGLAERVSVFDESAVPGSEAIARLALDLPRIDPALAAPLYVRDRVALTVAERLAAGGKA